MPALVLNPAEISKLMHDPKLSGFPMPLPAHPLPLESPMYREAFLDKTSHSSYPYPTIHQQQQSHQQQQPSYGRSLSHPLSSPFIDPRVPPLHPPYTEDFLDNMSAQHNSFLSLLSTFKADGDYRRSLGHHFGPSAAAAVGLGNNFSGVFDASDLYHPERLHNTVLASSLPTQISTLYKRMMSKNSAVCGGGNNARMDRADLSRISSSVYASDSPFSSLSPSSSLSKEAMTIESLKTTNDGSGGGRLPKDEKLLTLSMSPLRISESSTSSLSPSSPASFVSCSSSTSSSSASSSSRHYPKRRWASSPGSTPPTSFSSRADDSNTNTLDTNRQPQHHVSLQIGYEPATTSSLRDNPLVSPPNCPVNSTRFSSLLHSHSPSWHVASSPSSNDVFNASLPPMPPLFHCMDIDIPSKNPVESMINAHSDRWHLYHHHHDRQQRSPVDRKRTVSETLSRSSSPDDHRHRSLPGKELPTKIAKRFRATERLELTSAIETDREKSDRLSAIKKSASTQTQFSSYSHEAVAAPVPPPPPPYFTTHDTILPDGTSISPLHHRSNYPNHHHHHQQLRLSSLPPPPPPPPFSLSSAPSSSVSLSTSSSSLSTASSTPYPISSNSSSPHLHVVPPYSATSNQHSTRTPPGTSSSHSKSAYSASSTCPTTPTTPSVTNQKAAKQSLSSLPPYYVNGTPPPHPPPPPQYKDLTRSQVGVDVQDTPLNLSLSSEGTPISSSDTPTSPALVRSNSPLKDRNGFDDHSSWKQKNGNVQEVAADEAIEEHFRRSLGQKYANSSPSKSQNVDAASMTDNNTATFQTDLGSVDDHFARALGDQIWTAIKEKSEPSTPEVLPGTVDAHFAKALGASMWKKLQAKTAADVLEPTSGNSPPPHYHLHHHHETAQHHQPPKHPPTSASPIRPQLAM